MMDPPGAPLSGLDYAYYIPALLEAPSQDLAGEMARRVEYGASLKHNLCWAASHSPEDIKTDQHTMESLARGICGAQTA
jgi:hypothetical protein